VLATQWQVNHQSSSWILGKFYQSVQESKNPYDAIYQSRLSFLRDASFDASWKHPYFWAGLSYFGHQEDLNNDSFYWIFYMGLAILLLLNLAFFMRKKILS